MATTSASAPPTDGDERPITRVEPPGRWIELGFRELWSYRELLYFLVWRDIKGRYKQTAFGATWSLIQPITQMIVFTIIFGGLANLPSDGVPYPIFAFTGILPWMYFSSAFAGAGNSLLGGTALIQKVYFPRLIIPASAVSVPVVDFLLASTVLAGLFAWYGLWPSWRILVTPAFLALALLAATGAGLWVASLTVRYRDARFALPFLIQTWFFASPVIYPVSIVPEQWRWLLSLNPMAGVLDGFRWTLLDRPPPDAHVIGISLAAIAVLLVSGTIAFKRVERSVADII